MRIDVVYKSLLNNSKVISWDTIDATVKIDWDRFNLLGYLKKVLLFSCLIFDTDGRNFEWSQVIAWWCLARSLDQLKACLRTLTDKQTVRFRPILRYDDAQYQVRLG